jgi:hypothetical protein
VDKLMHSGCRREPTIICYGSGSAKIQRFAIEQERRWWPESSQRPMQAES